MALCEANKICKHNWITILIQVFVVAANVPLFVPCKDNHSLAVTSYLTNRYESNTDAEVTLNNAKMSNYIFEEVFFSFQEMKSKVELKKKKSICLPLWQGPPAKLQVSEIKAHLREK